MRFCAGSFIDRPTNRNLSCGQLQDRRSALGFGQRLPQMDAWLDENCGADGWAMTPAGGAVGIYFGDATLASAFVARWCLGSRAEPAGGVFRMRDDEPTPRVGAAQHSIP
jgi:hypothetical protein